MTFNRFIINFLKVKLTIDNYKRRKRYKTIDSYEHKLDVPFIDDKYINHKFDLFFAKEKRSNICVIDIHGGAYILGQHRDNFVFGEALLNMGYDFISLDYLPNNGKRDTLDLINDIYKGLRYVFDHLKELGLENDKFVIAGDSAGGHFALLFAELISNPKLAKEKFDFDLEDIDISSVIVNCPVYDFINITVGLTNGASKRMLGPKYFDKDSLALVSPKTYIEELKIPLFLSTCKLDFIRPHSLGLKEDLDRFNLKHTFLDIDSDNKKVDHVHNVIRPYLEESKMVNEAIDKFIKANI